MPHDLKSQPVRIDEIRIGQNDDRQIVIEHAQQPGVSEQRRPLPRQRCVYSTNEGPDVEVDPHSRYRTTCGSPVSVMLMRDQSASRRARARSSAFIL